MVEPKPEPVVKSPPEPVKKKAPPRKVKARKEATPPRRQASPPQPQAPAPSPTRPVKRFAISMEATVSTGGVAVPVAADGRTSTVGAKVVVLFDRPRSSNPAIRGNIAARIMFHTGYAGYFHRFTDKLSQESSIQLGYQEISTELGPDIFFDLAVTRLSVRSTWTYELWRQLALRGGLDMRMDWVDISLNSNLRPIEGESSAPLGTQRPIAVDKSTALYNPGAWVEAQASLEQHRVDPRPYLYSEQQLQAAETHDPLWNAAQRQLLREGMIHNYLRMLWGKKILEWTTSSMTTLAPLTFTPEVVSKSMVTPL